MGNVASWFEGFNAQMEQMEYTLAEQLLSAAQGAPAERYEAVVRTPPVVNQYVSFNVPVENPNDTKRKMQEVNQALAEML